MIAFYKGLEELEPGCTNIAMTVLDGSSAGAKALASDGVIVWQSEESGLFSCCLKEMAGMEQSGIYQSDGCQVFCEALGQKKRLVICGGGHVSIPLIQLGVMTGYDVMVLEDRPEFARRAEDAGADEVICAPFEEGLEKTEGSPDTFFVIVTRGHIYDLLCLEQACKKQHAYIGMIGSKKKAARVKEDALERGCSREMIDQVYTPIGLKIGAETPEEIAVAIMAEIIQVKNKRKRGGYPQEILHAVLSEKYRPGQSALACIVNRRGSAPRGAGAKMLVFLDGALGTIGGGSAELQIQKIAREMLGDGRTKTKLCHIDMTGREASEEGMVCGGIIDVFIEVI